MSKMRPARRSTSSKITENGSEDSSPREAVKAPLIKRKTSMKRENQIKIKKKKEKKRNKEKNERKREEKEREKKRPLKKRLERSKSLQARPSEQFQEEPWKKPVLRN